MLEKIKLIEQFNEYNTLDAEKIMQKSHKHHIMCLNGIKKGSCWMGRMHTIVSTYHLSALKHLLVKLLRKQSSSERVTLVGVAGVLFWMHWRLALFILLLNPVVILFSTRLGKRVKDLKKFENRAFEVFQDALSEAHSTR